MSYPQEDKKQQLYGDEKQQHDAPPPFSTQQQHRVGRGAPSPGPPRQGDTGTFPGGTYNITHRDNDAVLNVNLQQDGAFIRAKPGAMIYMSGSVQLSGKTNFSMRDMFSGKETAESTYLGPGRISLCPTLSGDVFPLYIDNQASWTIAKNVYLACTSGITRAAVRKSFKNVRAGDMILVYTVGGQGIIWLTSFGAIDRLDIQPGEQYVVDNGHLIAWNCEYQSEKAGGSTMTSLKTGEGAVSRFTGPGCVYVQTRNTNDFDSYIWSHSRS